MYHFTGKPSPEASAVLGFEEVKRKVTLVLCVTLSPYYRVYLRSSCNRSGPQVTYWECSWMEGSTRAFPRSELGKAMQKANGLDLLSCELGLAEFEQELLEVESLLPRATAMLYAERFRTASKGQVRLLRKLDAAVAKLHSAVRGEVAHSER